MTTIENKFRDLPSVDRILATDKTKALMETYSHGALVTLARDSLQAARQGISNGGPVPSVEELVQEIWQKANSLWRPSPGRVINATGVVIHTNLGRAPLSEEAAKAAMESGPATQTWRSTWKREGGEAGTRPSSRSLAVSQVPSPRWPLTTTQRPYTLS